MDVASSASSASMKMHERDLSSLKIETNLSDDVDMNESLSGSDDDDSQASRSGMGTGVWTRQEHARFLDAIKIYSNGPWKLVSAYIGTRTVRQTMTHAQKYRQKAARRLRGLRTKQALMRMHRGHKITEESLMQERLRTMGTATPTDVCSFSFTAAMGQSTEQLLSVSIAPVATQPSSPTDNSSMLASPTMKDAVTILNKYNSPNSPVSLKVEAPTELDFDDIDLLDKLEGSPSLEECVDELLELLF